MIPTMRTGFVGEVDGDDDETTVTVMVTLRLFMKDAIRVSGRYAIACERREVTGKDMKAALMYCARTFFDQRSDGELQRDVQTERTLMEEESGEEGEEEDLTVTPADLQLRRNVDTIVSVWDRWEPTDPVHILIKRAIDRTPIHDSPDLDETE